MQTVGTEDLDEPIPDTFSFVSRVVIGRMSSQAKGGRPIAVACGHLTAVVGLTLK